jgi:citrate lyase subunit beta/citryl-CoA lyase
MINAMEVRLGWRSFLFVPSDNARALARVALRGADAVIVDLEDGVAPASKPRCRDGLHAIVASLTAQGCSVVVRINADARWYRDDVNAAVGSGAPIIMLPKTASAQALEALDAQLLEAERAHGRELRSTAVIALIETAGALFRLSEIAMAPRVIGLALGNEDLCVQLAVTPAADNLTYPCSLIALAAAEAGIAAIGLPVSLADFGDESGFEDGVSKARRLGMTGALCIHPRQIDPVHRAFAPTPEDVEWAQDVIEQWQAVGHPGAFAHEGRMVDRPVIERAQALLARVRP